jgi:hypothetical protein
MYIHSLDKKRIKEIMRNLAVNGKYLSRDSLRRYKREFKYLQEKYPGIDFKQVAITK